MTKECIDLLGTETLMHHSDYPLGEAYFPDTAEMVINWPYWKEPGTEALQKAPVRECGTVLEVEISFIPGSGGSSSSEMN